VAKVAKRALSPSEIRAAEHWIKAHIELSVQQATGEHHDYEVAELLAAVVSPGSDPKYTDVQKVYRNRHKRVIVAEALRGLVAAIPNLPDEQAVAILSGLPQRPLSLTHVDIAVKFLSRQSTQRQHRQDRS
jgi:hypothetical protein